MKVVHVSSHAIGGAANAAIRINKALIKKGVDSSFLYNSSFDEKYRPVDCSSCNSFKDFIDTSFGKYRFKILKLLNQFMQFIPFIFKPKKTFFTAPFSAFKMEQHPLVKAADIIHLHWVCKNLNYPTFFRTVMGKPIVWTLHDMAPFTGGYNYLTDYDQDAFNQINDKYLKIKEKNLIYNAHFITTPSKWLGQLSEESNLFRKFKHKVIPNCIDVDVFNPMNKAELKKKYNIPEDKQTVLFVAYDVSDERKGFKYMQEALMKLNTSNIHLLVLGKSEGIQLDFSHTLLGSISNENQVAEVYNMADVFVISSIEDNLPNTVLESLACGVPVVGFDIGGIPDMITHKFNGYLAKEKDSDDLANGISYILEQNTGELQQNCLKTINEKFLPEIVANQYLSVYNSVLAD